MLGRATRTCATPFCLAPALASAKRKLAWIRDSVCDQLAKLPGGEGSAERLDAILNDIDELVEGKGDGVVAVKRGRLDGVSDTLVMPFGHLAVTGEPSSDVLRNVQRAVRRTAAVARTCLRAAARKHATRRPLGHVDA